MKPLSSERFDSLVRQFPSARPVLVIGDVGIDKYTLGEVTRISPEAPVPVLEVRKEWPKLGLAANISHNFATLEVPSSLVGVVGEDAHANKFEGLLEEIGLRTWGLVRDSARMTTLKERVTTSTQQICRIDYETPTDVGPEVEERLLRKVKDLSEGHGAVILQDYGKGLLHPQLCQRLITSFKTQSRLVAVDPYRTRHALQYRGATLMKPNLSEARMLCAGMGLRETDPAQMCMALTEKLDLQMIAITLGGEGLCVLDRKVHKAPVVVPTINSEVFDVSGAGDTALCALVATLAVGGTLEEAAWIANCASGVVVGKKGTATVTQEELRHFYARLTEELGA